MCPPSDFVAYSNLQLYYNSFQETCQPDGLCPFSPPSPYSTMFDESLDYRYRICVTCTAKNACQVGLGISDATSTAQYVSSSTRIVSRIVILLRVIRAFMGLNKVRRIGTLLRVTISARASKGVRRFRTMGFNLDLTYLTDRMVIMAAPSHNKLYVRDAEGKTHGLNNSHHVARFLATRHYGSFRIYNLCAEDLGDYAPQYMLCQMHRLPIENNTPPQLGELMLFCSNVERWLLGDVHNIVALHCSDGATRSGIVACAWLLHSGHRMARQDAMDLFARRRSGQRGSDGDYSHKVDSPAGARVLGWLEERLYKNVSIAWVERTLQRVEVDGLLPGSCYSLTVVCGRLSLFDSFDRRHTPTGSKGWGLMRNDSVGTRVSRGMSMEQVMGGSDDTLVFAGGPGPKTWQIGTAIKGDVRVCVWRHPTSNPKKARADQRTLALFFTLHTMFCDPDSVSASFSKDELDIAHRDKGNSKFAPTLRAVAHLKAKGEAPSEKTVVQQKLVELFEKSGVRHKTYRKGQSIVEPGSVHKALLMVKSGIVVQVTMESTSSSLTEAETVVVAMYGPGDIFGAGGFCLSLPETAHVAHSGKVDVRDPPSSCHRSPCQSIIPELRFRALFQSLIPSFVSEHPRASVQHIASPPATHHATHIASPHGMQPLCFERRLKRLPWHWRLDRRSWSSRPAAHLRGKVTSSRCNARSQASRSRTRHCCTRLSLSISQRLTSTPSSR